jgi:transmembrane sensor
MKPDDLEHHLDAARSRFEPRWDEAREAHVRAGLPARAWTHRRRRVAAVAVGLLAIGVVGFALRPLPSVVTLEPLADASVVTLERTPTLERYRVERQGAWFDVTPHRRVVQVEAGEVLVEVLGTRFLVERVDARVHVVVAHGTVRVTTRGSVQTLTAGAEGWFPAVAPSTAEPVVPPPSPAPSPAEGPAQPPSTPPAVPPAAPRPPSSAETRPARAPVAPTEARVRPSAPAPGPAVATEPTWASLAQAGDFDAAWKAMKAAPAPRDEPADLLLAADVARLSRHPEDALTPLRRVLDAHAADPRAPLAAFTLGRVLLDDLGRPQEAAVAFERVQTLAPNAPLAEDALAREVEALSRSQRPEARTRAESFVQRYPSSPRLRAVKHFGGLR